MEETIFELVIRQFYFGFSGDRHPVDRALYRGVFHRDYPLHAAGAVRAAAAGP